VGKEKAMKMKENLDPEDPDAVHKVVNALYPPGAMHCMMDCKFATGYSDGSGAYCNNSLCQDYEERVRSWDLVADCPQFVEGERILDRDDEAQQ